MILEKVYQKNGQWAEHIIEGYDSFAALVTDKYIDFEDHSSEEFEKEYFFFDEENETLVRNEKPLTEEDAAYWWQKLNGREKELVEVVGGVDNFQIYFKKDGKTNWEAIGPKRNIGNFNRDFADWLDRYGVEEAKDWADALDVLNTVGASAWAGTFCLAAE